jgi:hypothetical protein
LVDGALELVGESVLVLGGGALVGGGLGVGVVVDVAGGLGVSLGVESAGGFGSP